MTPAQQLLQSCERLEELDSYERPLTQWLTGKDQLDIIRIARLMPVMVEALKEYQRLGDKGLIYEDEVAATALAAIENEFPPEDQSTIAPV